MALSCLEKIVQDIVADCTVETVGGNKTKAWLLNLDDDFTFTFDATNGSKITSIVNGVGVQAYTLTVSRKGLNTGHDRVIEAGRSDRFTHFASFNDYSVKAADVEAIDRIGRFMIITEKVDQKAANAGEGVFKAYGVEFGLYPTSDSKRENDANGARVLELTSQDGDTEVYSDYTVFDTDYATTLALLVALETPGV